MLDKNKLEKLKKIGNDDSDLVLKFNEYYKREIPFENNNVFSSVDDINLNEEDTLYIAFCNEAITKENLYRVELNVDTLECVEDSLYYYGKNYEQKLSLLKIDEELLAQAPKYKKVRFVFEINAISSLPLWETKMHRKIENVLDCVNNLEESELNKKTLHKIVTDTTLKPIKNTKQYDIDLIIKYVKEVSTRKKISAIFISEFKEKRDRFLIEELRKLVSAANLPVAKRNEYIYDTTYQSMNNMFSRFGFCNFKEDKCISQRHKSITNRYPVPKTDGCCFKVVNKCQYNNKDGTCQIECLPCKLFTCSYLSKLGVGLRLSELILLRAFLTQKQRRLILYKFFRPKEFFMERM